MACASAHTCERRLSIPCWSARISADWRWAMLKSIGVVAGSYALSIILVLCTDPLLSRMFPGDYVHGQIPSTNPLLASTGLFIVISIFCAWLCARFAPGQPAKHVLWFFILGELMGIAS